MHQASVGFHCPECTKQGGQKVMRPGQLLSRPIVSQGLIAVNVAIFVVGMGSGLQTKGSVAIDYGMFGPAVGAGDWFRLVTSGFLHFNVLHIAFNMLALYQLGLLLEPGFGKLRFGLVYGVSLLAGSFGVVLVSPDSLTVGASGAVFGLMGFAFMAMRARGIDPFSTSLGGTIVINLILTFTLSRYISVGGHVGGLLGGALCGWILTDLGPRYLRDEKLTIGAVVALGLVLFGASIAVAQ